MTPRVVDNDIDIGKSVITFVITLAILGGSRSIMTLFLWDKMKLERVMGIEPTSRAWEAHVLPLYDTRNEELDSAKGAFSWQLVYHATIRVSSRTRLVISAFFILVVFCNPKPSQQKLAVTLP